MTGSRPDWAAVGRIIGEGRRALGLPKNEAARQARLSNTTWRLLEAGANHNPNDETLVRIAKVIDVDPTLLLQAAGRAAAETATPEATSTVTTNAQLASRHGELPLLPRSYPLDRTPDCKGRGEVLAKVAQYLEAWGGAMPPLALTGPPGIGKTTVAARYMADHRHAYDGLWWVNLGAPHSGKKDLAGLAAMLRIASIEGVAGPVALAGAIADVLGTDDRRWLLVLDGVDSDAALDVLEELSKGVGRVRLLVTSRRGAGWRTATPLTLEPMAPEDAAEFLRQRTGSLLSYGPATEAAPTEDAAEALAEELGYLPLALDRAGAYVDTTGISLKSFLDLVQTMNADDRLLDLLDRAMSDGTAKPPVWLPELPPDGGPARDLLRVLAFVAPKPLDPSHLLRRMTPIPASRRGLVEDDPITFGAVAQDLRHRSLVSVEDGGLRTNRIIQAAVRRSLGPEERAAWAGAAVNLLLGAFPVPDGGQESRATCCHLVPHARAAIQYALLHHADPSAVAQLLGRVAEHLRLEGELRAAIRDAEGAVDLLDKTEVPSLAVVQIRQTLALLHLDLGEIESAWAQLSQAREASEGKGVESHVLQLLEARLAAIDAHRGRYDSASQRVEQVCAFLARQPAHANTAEIAEVVSAVALVFQLLDEIEEARSYFGEALTLRRALRTSPHHNFALDCYGLGGVELRAGQPHRAAYWFELGIDVLEVLYGAEARHPRIGDGRRGLAAANRQAGNLTGALDRLNEAYVIYKDVYGFDHPVRKAVETTRDLLDTLLDRGTGGTGAVDDHSAGVEGLLSIATQRYIEQMLAIGNYAGGFDRNAEAVTALRLGDDLLGLGAIDGSLASFDRSVRLAEPDSLLALHARMRLGQALERHRRKREALKEYQAILEATEPDAEVGRANMAQRVRARAEQQLRQLQEHEAGAGGPVTAEAAGQRQ